MIQLLLIVGLACLPPFINRVYVKRQNRRQRVVIRRDELLRIINTFYDEQEKSA